MCKHSAVGVIGEVDLSFLTSKPQGNIYIYGSRLELVNFKDFIDELIDYPSYYFKLFCV